MALVDFLFNRPLTSKIPFKTQCFALLSSGRTLARSLRYILMADRKIDRIACDIRATVMQGLCAVAMNAKGWRKWRGSAYTQAREEKS